MKIIGKFLSLTEPGDPNGQKPFRYMEMGFSVATWEEFVRGECMGHTANDSLALSGCCICVDEEIRSMDRRNLRNLLNAYEGYLNEGQTGYKRLRIKKFLNMNGTYGKGANRFLLWDVVESAGDISETIFQVMDKLGVDVSPMGKTRVQVTSFSVFRDEFSDPNMVARDLMEQEGKGFEDAVSRSGLHIRFLFLTQRESYDEVKEFRTVLPGNVPVVVCVATIMLGTADDPNIHLNLEEYIRDETAEKITEMAEPSKYTTDKRDENMVGGTEDRGVEYYEITLCEKDRHPATMFRKKRRDGHER